MKPFNGRTIVKQERRLNDTIMVGGQEFKLDAAFRHYWNTVQMAEVIATCRDDIEPGDIVAVHHFVNAPEQILPTNDDYSYLEYNQIFAKIKDGEVKTLTNFVLVEPVTYGQAGLTEEKGGLLMTMKSPDEHMERVGIARHVTEAAAREGLEDGDIVLFNKNCEYEVLINNKIYYRMEIRDIITVIDKFSDLKA